MSSCHVKMLRWILVPPLEYVQHVLGETEAQRQEITR